MMAGMDDKDDVDDIITLEAMSSLSKILSQVSENDIQAILINITLRIRPCFEKVAARTMKFCHIGCSIVGLLVSALPAGLLTYIYVELCFVKLHLFYSCPIGRITCLAHLAVCQSALSMSMSMSIKYLYSANNRRSNLRRWHMGD